MNKNNNQAGFTIVELLVSTVIFTIILVGAMASMVQIGRLYFKGITTARTQEFIRNTSSEITNSIKFSREPINVNNLSSDDGPEIASGFVSNATGFFCIGPRRYSYVLDRKLVLNETPDELKKTTRHVLWVDTPDTGCANNSTIRSANLMADDPCDPAVTATLSGAGPNQDCSNGRELFTENMRLTKLDISQSTISDGLWNVSIGVAYGDDNSPQQAFGPLRTEGDRRICEGGSFLVQFCAVSELSTSVLRRVGTR